MTEEADTTDYEALMLQEVRRNYIVVTQQFNRHKVCFIPDDQATAIASFLKLLGRAESYGTGSKHSNEMRVYFEPPLSDEELEQYEE